MASITYEKFLAAQAKEDYPAEPEQLTALKTLFSDPTIPISQAAQQIVAPTLKYLEQNPGSQAPDNDFILWRTIASAIKQLPEFNDRLLELVLEINKIPAANGYFKGLYDFYMHWREFAFSFSDPPSTDPERATKRQEWVNINAFTAKLSTHASSDPALDARSWAGSVLRDTLEKTPWEGYDPTVHADEDEEERTYQAELHGIKVLDGRVPAAAQWMIYNAKGLYENKGLMGDEYDHDPTNWKGQKGWSKERFAYWRERFEWVSTVNELDEATRQAAKEAVEVMKKVEK
ncbi:hypothetical protein G7Y89_g7132 [Cudoniella acicularis]|uniref:Uncharacterized protein n=1 Tax=Cudoniella acicularis TaxID=354080 RepID=A0A8H4W4V1_9HELO|nr:hypothetical protein G7Y89_g7132 [Cudoniella acicularis]